jgi:hypothetical protein
MDGGSQTVAVREVGDDSSEAAEGCRLHFKGYSQFGPLSTSRSQPNRHHFGPLRFWRAYDYQIAYAADELPLWEVSVMHGQRIARTMAAIPKS